MPRSPMLVMTEDERGRATRIAALRIIIGSLAFLPPRLIAPAFGLPLELVTPTAQFFARAFGIRNIVLGTMTLRLRDAELQTRRANYALNAVIDAVDVVILTPSLRSRRTSRFGATSIALGTSALLAWLDLLGETG